MAWGIVTRKLRLRRRRRAQTDNTLHGRWRRAGRGLTGLTVRILGVNLIPLLVLGIGISYLGQYKASLVRAELETLKAQAQLFAGAISEGAVRPLPVATLDDTDAEMLVPELSRRMVRRLGETTENRTRLLDVEGSTIGDSYELVGPGGRVQMIPIPPPAERGLSAAMMNYAVFMLGTVFPLKLELPPYPDCQSRNARTCPDVIRALDGKVSASVWRMQDGNILLSAAAPVQKIRQVIGAVLLTRDGRNIEAALTNVRRDVLRVFLGALAMTILLSLYLSRVIGRPLKRLAVAAETVRIGKGGRNIEIPDLSRRGDEIGELSVALREMTRALWDRMDSIERFAADVAHEIKNPLTSLRSAVETADRISDPDKRERLMKIILHDVQRLDRLISDISAASRLDTELFREELRAVDLGELLAQIADAMRDPLARADARDTEKSEDICEGPVRLDLPEDGPVMVAGSEMRLAQVFRNLLGNALSFSPPGGRVQIGVRRERSTVIVTVEDHGPGIPEGKLETIFERFYSERPPHESYGGHSGLGLSIARQIVTAHGGTIRAENLRDESGTITGARFTVVLNAA